MDANQEASVFLATSRNYLDGKLTAQQAADALGAQVKEMLAHGTWKNALYAMKAEGSPGQQNTKPTVKCVSLHPDFQECYIDPSRLDYFAIRNRAVHIRGDRFDSVKIQLEAGNTVEATFEAAFARTGN